MLPDDSEHRERRKAPVTSRWAAQRWGEERERVWYHELMHPEQRKAKEVPTLEQFAPLDAITTERVQGVKHHLRDRAPKTVNNVLTVLNMLLKKAVEWSVIERMPCTVRLLPIPKPSAGFHDFAEFECLVDTFR